MQLNLQLIQITNRPTNKNCWLDVSEFPQLKKQYSTFIQFYDFIDFEGDVFYFNVVHKFSFNVDKSFYKQFLSPRVLDNIAQVEELLNFITPADKQALLQSYKPNNTLVLLG